MGISADRSFKRAAWSLKILVLSIYIVTLAAIGAVEAFASSRYVEGEVLVVLRNDARRSGVGALNANTVRSQSARRFVGDAASSAGARTHVTYDALSSARGRYVVWMRSDTQTTEQLIAELKKNPDVLSVTPNFYVHSTMPHDAPLPNDPHYINGDLWGMTRIRAPHAWNTHSITGDHRVHVAVVDSGIQNSHVDLYDNYAGHFHERFTQPGGVGNDGAVLWDGHGHGTHVAGTIAAVGNNFTGVVGVNWHAKVINLKALRLELDGQGRHIANGTFAWLAEAINHIVGILTDPENDDIVLPAVNLSLGGWARYEDAEVLREAFRALDGLNRTVIVVAAGNDRNQVGVPNAEGKYFYPASLTGINNMIVVGAIDINNAAASFTSWSSDSVHIVAPGVNILSTSNNGGYIRLNGTSMATPHVTGAAALLAAGLMKRDDFETITKDNKLAPLLKHLILSTANGNVNPVLPPGSPAPRHGAGNRVSTYGLLDVGTAMDVLRNLPRELVFATDVVLTTGPADVGVGQAVRLGVAFTPHDTSFQSVAWSSDNPDVATVDRDGLVRGISNGTANIEARVIASGVSKSIPITVTNMGNGGGGGDGGGGGGCNSGFTVFAIFALSGLATRIGAKRR